MSVIEATRIITQNPAAYTVEMDGEAVILDEEADRLHVLNATATLVWQCLDGVSTIEEICVDLAEGLGVPYDQVLADTLAVVDNMLAEGLARDVSQPLPPAADTEPDTGPIVEPPNP